MSAISSSSEGSSLQADQKRSNYGADTPAIFGFGSWR
jgi:hypothetical protein